MNQSSGILTDVFERITDAFVALDTNWCYTYMNKRAGEIFHRNPVDMIGKHIWTEFPEGIDQSFYKAYYKAMAEQQYIHVEEYYSPYDKWFENHIYPSSDGLSIFFRDITEQKKHTRELELREKHFQALLENNPSIIALTDDALNPIYRSPSSTHITGWTDENMKMTGDIDRIHPDDISTMTTTIAEAIKNPGIPQPYISRYLNKNGDYIWLEGTATKLPDDCVVKGIVFNARDVTEKIELEQLLLKANKLARIGNWDVDLIKQTVYWSDITREIHEAESSFVLDLATGINFYKEGASRELITQKVKEAIELGKPFDEELEIVTVKNNIRWIRAIGETEMVDGRCVKIYGSFQDITERKLAEEKILFEQLDKMALINSTDDFIWSVSKDLNLIAANQAFIDNIKMVVGVDLKAGDKILLKVFPEELLDQWQSYYERALMGESFREESYSEYATDKTSTWIETAFNPIYHNQNIIGIACFSRDITERKKAEEKIRLSEIGLLKAQEIGKFGYWQQDLRSDIVWASKEAMLIYGFGPQEGELQRATIAACIIDVNKVKEAFVNLVEHGKEYNIDIRINPADGSPMRYISTLAELEKNERGVPTRIVGTLQDITERKKAEQAMKESQEKFQALVTASSDIIYRISPDWTIMNQLDGRGFIEDIVKPNSNWLREYIHPNDQPLLISVIKEAMSATRIFELEHRILRADGTFGWVFSRAVPLFDAEGNIIEWFGAASDITERKKAEETLNEKNKFIESIINASPSIIYIYDIEEGKNVFINDGIKTNLGYTNVEIEEMGNQVLPALMHPEDFETYITDTFPQYSVIRDKEIITHEFRMISKSGNWKWFYCTESVFFRKPNGIPKEIFGIVTDITERKEAEDEIKKYNARFQLIARTTNDALWEWNFETGELWANQTHQQLYDLDISDPVPTEKAWEQKIHPADREKVIATKRNAYESDAKIWISEYRFETKNGFIDIYDRCYIIRNADGKAIRATGTMQDITERKKAEEELRLSENRTRRIFESDMIGFIYWDVNGEVLDANDRFLEMTGYSKQDLKENKINWSNMTPHEYQELDRIAIENIANTGICQPYEKEYIRKNGSRLAVLIGATALEGSNYGKGVSYVLDITERINAQKKLKENEIYLRTILNTEPECVKILNSKGELLSMNPAGLAMIEAENEQQVLGHRLTELVDKKYRLGFNRLSKEVFKGNSGTFEFEVTGLKGGRRWLETHAVPLKDITGNIINLLGVTTDITNRKLAALEITASELKYRRLFESAKDGILILNAETGFIEDVNSFLCEMLHYSHAEFLDKQLWEISLFKDIAANKESFLKLKAKNYVRYENMPLVTKTGQPIWVEFISNVYDVKGKPVIQCSIRNITDRKMAEDEIIKTTEELRQLTAHLQTIREEERKRIAREIHDELGQQLTAIKMDTVWIDKQISAESISVKNKLKNMIELLDGSHQSVRKILNELRPAALDDNGILETLQWLGAQFTETSATPVHFTSNQTIIKLSQEAAVCIFRVYQEALTNIMRYAEASKVVSSLNLIDNKIVLTIEDDGKGFNTAAVQSKNSFGLLGMKERVYSLNGVYDLISLQDKGTKIVVNLPYTDVLT